MLVGLATNVTITPASASALEAQIVSFDVRHEADVTEIKDGSGALTGVDIRNERIVGTLTCQLYKNAGAPALLTDWIQATGAGTSIALKVIALANIDSSAGSTAGRDKINGNWILRSPFRYREQLGQPVEFTMNLWQGESIPAQ